MRNESVINDCTHIVFLQGLRTDQEFIAVTIMKSNVIYNENYNDMQEKLIYITTVAKKQENHV